MNLEIITPEKIYFSGEVTDVKLPGHLGSFELLDNHAPIISSLTKGTLFYTKDKKVNELKIEGGFVEVNKNSVVVCIEEFEAGSF